jgi:hypothetical protein
MDKPIIVMMRPIHNRMVMAESSAVKAVSITRAADGDYNETGAHEQLAIEQGRQEVQQERRKKSKPKGLTRRSAYRNFTSRIRPIARGHRAAVLRAMKDVGVSERTAWNYVEELGLKESEK